MIKRLLFALLFLNALTVSAQTKMVEVFLNIPDSLVLLLTNNDRMDLLDFAESNMLAKVTNRLDKPTTLDRLTDDYLHLTLTGISTLEMKLFPLPNDKLQAVAVVKTVKGPAKDSFVRLFTSDWSRELRVEDYVRVPDLGEYWAKRPDEMTDEELQIVRQLDPVLIQVSLSPDDKNIVFQRSFGMLPRTDQPKAEQLLKVVSVEW